jgi:hypothetical protein
VQKCKETLWNENAIEDEVENRIGTGMFLDVMGGSPFETKTVKSYEVLCKLYKETSNDALSNSQSYMNSQKATMLCVIDAMMYVLTRGFDGAVELRKMITKIDEFGTSVSRDSRIDKFLQNKTHIVVQRYYRNMTLQIRDRISTDNEEGGAHRKTLVSAMLKIVQNEMGLPVDSNQLGAALGEWNREDWDRKAEKSSDGAANGIVGAVGKTLHNASRGFIGVLNAVGSVGRGATKSQFCCAQCGLRCAPPSAAATHASLGAPFQPIALQSRTKPRNKASKAARTLQRPQNQGIVF